MSLRRILIIGSIISFTGCIFTGADERQEKLVQGNYYLDQYAGTTDLICRDAKYSSLVVVQHVDSIACYGVLIVGYSNKGYFMLRHGDRSVLRKADREDFIKALKQYSDSLPVLKASEEFIR